MRPAAALIDRFRADVEMMTGPPPQRLGVAVSGGPDSLALLLLAAAAYPRRVEAATVDHRLRPESGDEAVLVAQVAARLHVPHAILPLQWEEPPTGNIQARCRKARYDALQGWAKLNGLKWIATAHHIDDQAETILLRLARGSGVAGLAGARQIWPLWDDAADEFRFLIRPLLSWRKAELGVVVTAAGFDPVDDPTNRDLRFDRSRARALLADTAWLRAERLAASASHLKDAEVALAWMAATLFPKHVRRDEEGVVLVDVEDLPRELQRRLLTKAFGFYTDSQALPGPKLTRLLEGLRRGCGGTLAGVQAQPGPPWRLTSTPPHAPARALATRRSTAKPAPMRISLLTPDASYASFRDVWEARVRLYSELLAPHGLQVEPVPWTDAAPTRPALASLAWGYHLQPARWDALLAAWPDGAPLFNPPALLRWNSDKRYLAALAAAGVATVPTRFVARADAAALAAARAAFRATGLVVKPRISAASHATTRVGPDDAAPDLPDAMIQPFIPAVQQEGELSLFYFGGARGHAVRKVAAAGDFRVQREYGGAFTAALPTAAEIELAETALAAAPATPLYARVDMVTGPAGAPLLMELELIEPDLFLDHDPDDGAAFAEALVRALR